MWKEKKERPRRNSYKVNVTTYEMRIPEIGDKRLVSVYFASQYLHSNQTTVTTCKGVISYIVERRPAFVGHSGQRCDVIVSVHALLLE